MRIDPNPQLISNKDETFSYHGKKDFVTQDNGAVKEISSGSSGRGVRPKKSENNSYT